MMKLAVSGDRRFLRFVDGTPFFYLGDTAWELFHRLNREETLAYLDVRARQGFNVIQAVALAELDGLTVPNRYGRVPLKKNAAGVYDPCLPDDDDADSYWAHVDFTICEAGKRGLFVGLLPTWGDKFHRIWGAGPEIFTPENAYEYGAWIGARYRDCENLIWILGGDRPLDTENARAVIDAMARGIQASDNTHLMTFHPCGGRSSADVSGVPERAYIDFHAIQSSHAMEGYDSWKLLRTTAEAEAKPFLDMEPRYEDHPACFDGSFGYYWNADDVRMNLYWNMMEGACGNTYGNHCIWSFTTEPTDYFPYQWQEALLHEGAEQVRHAKALRYSRDYFSFHRDDALLVSNENVDDVCMARIAAGRGTDYAYLYTPLGEPFTADLSGFAGKGAIASWFNPRTGETTQFAAVPLKRVRFTPPTAGKGNDWLLIVDIRK